MKNRTFITTTQSPQMKLRVKQLCGNGLNMYPLKAALLLPTLLVLLSFHPAVARPDNGTIPEICREATTEQLYEMISYLPDLPKIKEADMEPVVCLSEREDPDGDIFSELQGLYYGMEEHSSRYPALEAIDKALVKLNPEEARDFLIRDLDHDEDGYRHAAMLALGQLEDEEILEIIAGMKFDLGFQNQVQEVFLLKTYEQTRVYILEMLRYPEFQSAGIALGVLNSYLIHGVIALGPEDEELFELLEEITEDRGDYSDYFKKKARKLITSLRALPGAPELE